MLNLVIPTTLSGVDDKLLNPGTTWESTAAYEIAALKLASKFIENFRKFVVTDEIIAAGPQVSSI